MSLGSIKARNESLDACYGVNHSSEWPATVYLHLFAGNPTTGGPELTSAGGYASVAIPSTAAGWSPATGGQKANAASVPLPTSTGAWSATATYFWLSDAASALAQPGTPTIANVGATGTTTYQYVVTALNGEGETTPSNAGVTTTGDNVLSATNYNTIGYSAVTNATSYNVYKIVNGAYQLLGNTTALSLSDTGQATTSQAPPASNTTMTLLDGGPLSAPIIVPAAGYAISFPPGSILIATQ